MSLAYKAHLEKSKKQGKKAVSPRIFCQVKCTKEEKRTKQSEASACDINNIMKRYINTGRLPEYIKDNPQYGDFSAVSDYQESLNTVIKAREQFQMLPSSMREKCMNDPAKFLEFVANPENREALIKMRLAKPRKEEGVELTPSTLSKLAEGLSGALKGDLPPQPARSPAGSKEKPKKSST